MSEPTGKASAQMADETDKAENPQIKAIINAGGRYVELNTNEAGMTTERLVEMAGGAWDKTAPTEPERLGPAMGYASQIDADDPFRQAGSRRRWLDEGRPLDAS